MTGLQAVDAAYRVAALQGLPDFYHYHLELHISTSTVSGCHDRHACNRVGTCGALISCPSCTDRYVSKRLKSEKK